MCIRDRQKRNKEEVDPYSMDAYVQMFMSRGMPEKAAEATAVRYSKMTTDLWEHEEQKHLRAEERKKVSEEKKLLAKEEKQRAAVEKKERLAKAKKRLDKDDDDTESD